MVISHKKHMPSSILKGTFIIIGVGIIAKILSFISEAILAAILGTTYLSDAYYMVAGIQILVYPMLSIGIWKVFLPMYKDLITKGANADAGILTNKVITFIIMCSCIIVILLLLFSQQLVNLIAPGFDGRTSELCAKLVRWSAIMYVFIALSSVYSAMLQSRGMFFASQIREVASHIPTIIVALFFYDYFGVIGLAVALALGGLFRLLVQLPYVKWGYSYKFDLNFRDRNFGVFFRRLPSALISEGIIQTNAFVGKVFASTLPIGSVSCLNYGQRLINFFSGLLSSAVATALYPQMIELISLKQIDRLSRLMVNIYITFALIMIPATAICYIYSNEIVRIVFQRGMFDANSTETTASVFALYSLGLFFTACFTITINLFYSWGDTKTPMYISLMILILNIILNFAMIGIWGIMGLALATSVSSVFSFIISFICSRKLFIIEMKNFYLSVVKILIATLISLSIPIFIKYSLKPSDIWVFVPIIIVVPMYIWLIKKMRVEEVDVLISVVLSRLKKKK